MSYKRRQIAVSENLGCQNVFAKVTLRTVNIDLLRRGYYKLGQVGFRITDSTDHESSQTNMAATQTTHCFVRDLAFGL